MEVKNREEMTPLLTAAGSGCTRCVQVLLQHHADPQARDYEGHTALHWAVITNSSDREDFRGDPELVKLLLTAGVDSAAKDDQGRTALDEAIAHKCTAIIRLLRARS